MGQVLHTLVNSLGGNPKDLQSSKVNLGELERAVKH